MKRLVADPYSYDLYEMSRGHGIRFNSTPKGPPLIHIVDKSLVPDFPLPGSRRFINCRNFKILTGIHGYKVKQLGVRFEAYDLREALAVLET